MVKHFQKIRNKSKNVKYIIKMVQHILDQMRDLLPREFFLGSWFLERVTH